jgi:hypothetical protein
MLLVDTRVPNNDSVIEGQNGISMTTDDEECTDNQEALSQA